VTPAINDTVATNAIGSDQALRACSAGPSIGYYIFSCLGSRLRSYQLWVSLSLLGKGAASAAPQVPQGSIAALAAGACLKPTHYKIVGTEDRPDNAPANRCFNMGHGKMPFHFL
jgi:hypothetical protein